MSRLRQLIREIHRRSLWQVLGIYLAGSWVVLQVVVATAFVQEGAGFSRPADGAPAEAKTSGGSSAGESSGHVERILTWRNALLGGILAIALWGVSAATWLVLRGMQRIEETPQDDESATSARLRHFALTRCGVARVAVFAGRSSSAKAKRLRATAADSAVAVEASTDTARSSLAMLLTRWAWRSWGLLAVLTTVGCASRASSPSSNRDLLRTVEFHARSHWGSSVLHVQPASTGGDDDLAETLLTHAGLRLHPSSGDPWGLTLDPDGQNCSVDVYVNGVRVVPRDFGMGMDFPLFLRLRDLDGVELHVGPDGPVVPPTPCGGALLLWSRAWRCRAESEVCRALSEPDFTGSIEGRITGAAAGDAVAVAIDSIERQVALGRDRTFTLGEVSPGEHRLLVLGRHRVLGEHRVRVFAHREVVAEIQIDGRGGEG